MNSIFELEDQLSCAVSQRLICSYEHEPLESFIIVNLQKSTTGETKQKLKEHIRNKYKCVSWVSFGSGKNEHIMFIKYSQHLFYY